MEKADFEKLVDEAFNAFPKPLRDAMSNVAIVIEDVPRARRGSEVEIGHGGVLMGLYEGVPQPAWGRSQSGNLPDKITIFQKSIEYVAQDEDAVKKLVEEVVWHEIGHHFGFSDEQLRKIERRRRTKKKDM